MTRHCQTERGKYLLLYYADNPSSGDLVVLHDENNEINVELIVSTTVKYSDRVGEFLKRNHQSISGLNTLLDTLL